MGTGFFIPFTAIWFRWCADPYQQRLGTNLIAS
jgi:hypothetical protein